MTAFVGTQRRDCGIGRARPLKHRDGHGRGKRRAFKEMAMMVMRAEAGVRRRRGRGNRRTRVVVIRVVGLVCVGGDDGPRRHVLPDERQLASMRYLMLQTPHLHAQQRRNEPRDPSAAPTTQRRAGTRTP